MDASTHARPDICLVTSGHVSSTPRLVKNADALSAAGLRVHVVALAGYPPNERLDQPILRRAAWSHQALGPSRGWGRLVGRSSQAALRALGAVRPPRSPLLAARAHHARAGQLARAAASVNARFYLGHCLAALPAVAHAARVAGVGFGFDLEDFHDAETKEALADPLERHLRRVIQAHFLPQCRPLFCASPLIAQAYKEAYGVDAVPVLNVFPLWQAPERPSEPPAPTDEHPAVLYWFSQTVGPGRGLEQIVKVLGAMKVPVRLELRGYAAPSYRAALQALAERHGLRRRIVFLEPGAPEEMARLAAPASLGLSIEESLPMNRDICLTNKVFVYLLAGIPQVLSPTRAQTAIARSLGDAAILAALDNPAQAAAALDRMLGDPERMARARRTAAALARSTYCWDVEQAIVVSRVREALGRRA